MSCKRYKISDRRVLLLGGSSGVGKTTAARALGRKLQMPHVLVDDIRIALQAVVSPQQHPTLHTFRGDFLDEMTSQQIVDGLIAVGRAVTPALHTIVSHHLARADAGPILLEGDGILPELVAKADFRTVAGMLLSDATRQVRSAFLIEPDEEALLEALLGRSPAASHEEASWQRRYAHASWHYGQWLYAEAQRYELPVVAPRPFDTLIERLLATFEEE